MIGRPLLLATGALVVAGVSVGAALARPDGPTVGAASGAELFVYKGCATCHNGPGVTSSFGIGPSLATAASWAATRVDGLSAEEYLAESMVQPSAYISPAWEGPNGPTSGMPQLQLTQEDVDALVDYLLAHSAGDASGEQG